MKIAFIGIGNVGSALANGLAENGHEVVIAAHDLNSKSVQAALAKIPALKAKSIEEAVSEADVVFLATPFAVGPGLPQALWGGLIGLGLLSLIVLVYPHGMGLGDAKLAHDVARDLLDKGIYVIGFSYPVVPKGQARIRVQLSAAHAKEHLDRAIEAFAEVGRKHGIVS